MLIFKSHQAPRVLAAYLKPDPVIVEAGAFDGRDTKLLARQFLQGMIHAFEPVPDIFERLLVNTAQLPNVRCYNMALSNTDGFSPFYVAEQPYKPGRACQAGSLHKPKERLEVSPIEFPRTITVPTITLCAWAKQNNVTKIDALWLDMQGHELTVLESLHDDLLLTITAIYTEVSFIQAYANQPLYDTVKQWMEAHAFVEVAKTFSDEKQWFFGNSLFLNKTVHRT